MPATSDEPNPAASAGPMLVAALTARLARGGLIDGTVHLSVRVGGGLPGMGGAHLGCTPWRRPYHSSATLHRA
jgi:hypothetical protein